MLEDLSYYLMTRENEQLEALTSERDYPAAIDKIWNSMVESKLYITGDTGGYANHKAFEPGYSLANMTAYNETCASKANILWNERMFGLHGDAAYIDVLESILITAGRPVCRSAAGASSIQIHWPQRDRILYYSKVFVRASPLRGGFVWISVVTKNEDTVCEVCSI